MGVTVAFLNLKRNQHRSLEKWNQENKCSALTCFLPPTPVILPVSQIQLEVEEMELLLWMSILGQRQDRE